MVNCPHCNGTAMTLMQKSALGPGRAVPCRSCGKTVASHWVGILAAIPAFLGGYVFLNTESVHIGFAAVAAGILVMALLQTFLVPLMKYEG
jgi:hypothetical protein